VDAINALIHLWTNYTSFVNNLSTHAEIDDLEHF